MLRLGKAAFPSILRRIATASRASTTTDTRDAYDAGIEQAAHDGDEQHGRYELGRGLRGLAQLIAGH